MPDQPISLSYRTLGSSGIRVSSMCLGTMTFGTAWGWGADEETCRQMYEDFRDAGGNFLDTANLYTSGQSEEIVGQLIAGHREEVVVGTKFTMPIAGDPNASGSHRKSLRRSVESSLRRLGTDYLDVLWIHAWDRATPVEETMRALDDLVRAGSVLTVGASNMPAWVVAGADAIAEVRGRTRFSALQVEYSLANRTAERELLPMAKARGEAVLAWSPLGRGLLAGKPRPADAPALETRVEAVLGVLKELAAETGTSPARVALAWTFGRGLIPIVGATSAAQLGDNLAAAMLDLDDGQLERLDASSATPLGYPHEFLRDRTPFLEA